MNNQKTKGKKMSTETHNEYLLLFRGRAWYNGLSAEELQTAMGKFKAWRDRLSEQGKVKAAQPLAREGRIVTGKPGRVVADGPFAESKEAVGGYFLLAVDSIEEATEIAKSCPGLEYGASIEIRPVAEECPMTEHARLLASGGQLATAAA
jgi:hypothetical protein